MLLVLVLLLLLIGAGAWLYAPDLSRAVLEQRYHAAGDEDLAVAGVRLHVRDTGRKDAPAIILLHGFGDSLLTFEAWAWALSADHRVIRYDLPGFGLTGADPTGDYSDERGIAVLVALMDRLGLARASLVGNSMGGRLAWRFAAAEPARVDRLVLISPDGFASPGREYETHASVPLLVRALPYVLPTMLVRMSLAPAFADPARMTDAMVAQYRDMLRAPGVRASIVARMAQEVLHDPTDRLRQIRAPTLLLWGERDGMIPFGNAADYMRLIPDCRLASLPSLGHVPQQEAPALSLAPVAAFLGAQADLANRSSP